MRNIVRSTRIVVIGLALAFGCFVSTPSASAAPMTCRQAQDQSMYYMALGNIAYIFGDYQRAGYYYGKAEALMEAAC